ncbi:MAG: acyl-CoA thioesterase [Aquincola sp.]|nr:acyl-CoA thioesterase [Aquincola sp.]
MAGEVFEIEETVRFAHCDPAGIVFFPQYLVMLNTLHERWFSEALGVPYHDYIGQRRLGVPTVRLECDFTAISRHGDRLRQRLALTKLGRTSIDVAAEFVSAEGELRARFRQVLVCTSLVTHKPHALPNDLRAGMQRFVREP